ncbi:MAG TPA: arabinofuranosidase catalytic domain-containing protein [Terracidiphilus sp.]|nr:arabinofuranosidase catalytic domain-containing protein [Terracidiphilus sp.]
MKTKILPFLTFATLLAIMGVGLTMAQPADAGSNAAPSRPQGPCDIYAAADDPCVAAHSTTRALYASYDGPLYQVRRQSDGKTLDIGVVEPTASPVPDPGGYADAAAQDAFCANTVCWITKIYDQSPKHNDLTQAPRGGFSGPAMGGFNNVPIADMAPITIMGHKVYGAFIEPGMGLRNDDPKGTAVDDQAEGQYWVVSGKHFNSGCCFDYGNAEIDSRDDDNGTMETAYFGDAPSWFHGHPPGPWIMTDQENNLVGCVNSDGTKFCPNLPSITWPFVTAIANGEPHHWMTMGGDAQRGDLTVMFSGPRVNATYDPMRKQGAILLGNGGDNSNGSQGTFYEGAVTAANTFPTEATEQQVQANIVAARYAAAPLILAPASSSATPPGIQIFSPNSSQSATLSFTNSTNAPAADLQLSISVPDQWTSVIAGATESSKTFSGPIAPGASVTATFNITSGSQAFNGDLIGKATWSDPGGQHQSETTTEKVRNVAPVRINEFRISSGPPANSTDSFIELYNAGDSPVDISNWTLTERPAQHAISSAIKIPSGTQLASHAFYLLGLSNSGLAVAARAGDATVYVRSTTGMKAGDTITIGSGTAAESRKIATVGAAAAHNTTVWQPLPDGPILTIPAGATNIPVTDTSGFVEGEKMALGYGATYPTDPAAMERYEVVTISSVGKPGTQAYLAADASAGATNIKVTSVADISAGDQIRLDIDSVGHGIETVTVTRVGTAATRTKLAADAPAGGTSIKVRGEHGFAVGDKIIIGTGIRQSVTVTAISASGRRGAEITFTPALNHSHINDEEVVEPGTGLDLAAPLKFSHASNLPFSDRGTGITFQPATAYAHISNEPVQPLGTGITLDRALSGNHDINAVVRDAAVTTAGYQGSPAPNQWFGGPELATIYPLFGRAITINQGSMVLRDVAGLVVDSLNYGALADPWAAEGYQAASGPGASGCYVTAPGPAGRFGPFAPPAAGNTSAGRFPDGADSGSNCTDFVTAPATTLSVPATAGATNIKVASVEDISSGQTIHIGAGEDLETANVAEVGTAGGTTLRSATAAGATVIPVAGILGFTRAQEITIGSGTDAERAVIGSIERFPAAAITVTAPLAHAYAAGAQIAGSGITLAAPLTRDHASGAPVTGNSATPGAPNRYDRKTP